MSRPLRIEYPDAWYHVMNRGRRTENILSEQRDYNCFLDLLMESSELWNVKTSAYCLMPTHYHILLQTPNANLSRFMRHIDGVYTQRFNRSHQCDGQLFRGRYKSILVDADSYLLELMRYIHRNPLEAGLVDRPDAYDWSSHKGYVSDAKKWSWLHKDYVLSMFTRDKKQQRRLYKQFVAMNSSEEIIEVFKRKRLPSVLGSERFLDWVKDRFRQKEHEEVPESRILAPDRGKIKQVVCESYHVNEEDLLRSQRGLFNEPRNVAIYLTRRRGEGLDEICREFGMKRYSSASSVIERVRVRITKDRQFKKRVDQLGLLLTKSQT
jgi:putative transposase